MTPDEFKILVELVEDVKENIPFEEFVIKYSKVDIKFPSLEAVLRFKRNECIKNDKKNGLNIDLLTEKYSLSKDSIENILYRNKSKETL